MTIKMYLGSITISKIYLGDINITNIMINP